ncbi:hypothetical protein CGRA01v4_01119 [Colletotrichum graminicola]|nr:hypothetical protein CGRA01v4_01119 [Colletotrichum graminicola]
MGHKHFTCCEGWFLFFFALFFFFLCISC